MSDQDKLIYIQSVNKDNSRILNAFMYAQTIKNETIREQAQKVLEDMIDKNTNNIHSVISKDKLIEMYKMIFKFYPEEIHMTNLAIVKSFEKNELLIAGCLTQMQLYYILCNELPQIEPYFCSLREMVTALHILGYNCDLADAFEKYLDKFNPIKIIVDGVKDSENPILQRVLQEFENNFLKNIKNGGINEGILYENNNYALVAPGSIWEKFIPELTKNQYIAEVEFIRGNDPKEVINFIDKKMNEECIIGYFDYKNGNEVRSWHYSNILGSSKDMYFTTDSSQKLSGKDKIQLINEIYVKEEKDISESFKFLTGFMKNCSDHYPKKDEVGTLDIGLGGYNLLCISRNDEEAKNLNKVNNENEEQKNDDNT